MLRLNTFSVLRAIVVKQYRYCTKITMNLYNLSNFYIGFTQIFVII